jgi:hypothetical protein
MSEMRRAEQKAMDELGDSTKKWTSAQRFTVISRVLLLKGLVRGRYLLKDKLSSYKLLSLFTDRAT